MPIYEYLCKCGEQFEMLQPFSAALFSKCPKCGKKAAREISLGSFHLKGSGWYSKDTKISKSMTKMEKTEKSEKSETTAAKSDSESKPSPGAETQKHGAGHSNSETPKSETAKSENTKSETAKKPSEKPTKTAKKESSSRD